jgi:hypothetical protein
MPTLRTLQGHILPLPPRRVSIGASAGSDIPIASGYGVAALHLYLQPWESGYFLEDAASGLGTLVNGSPVTWAPLKHGDVITAGTLTLLYEQEGTAPISAFSAPPVHPAAPQPPAWLPAEALLPPLSPAAQAALKNDQSGERKGRGWKVAGLLVATAIAAVAVWWYLRHR